MKDSKSIIHKSPAIYSAESCEKAINWFEENIDEARPGGAGKHSLNNLELNIKGLQDPSGFFNLGFTILKGLEEFKKEYELFYRNVGEWYLDVGFIQMSKWEPNNYYDYIHCETCGPVDNFHSFVQPCFRIFSWMMYLNDIEEDGGTEFVNQGITTIPRAGDFYMFPSGASHLHRGINAPRETKYTITGHFTYPLHQVRILQQRKKEPEKKSRIVNVFPTPVYVAKRETEITTSEREDIKSIIAENSFSPYSPSYTGVYTKDSYILNTKLPNLKKFFEGHVDNYVKEVINPKSTELNFYITQSWLNIVKPGANHQVHNHSNSIISGVYYVSVVEGDAIQFYDPSELLKQRISIEIAETNVWNAQIQDIAIKENEVILFPSYAVHGVRENKSGTADRISIAFNVFLKGKIGDTVSMNELVL